MIESWRWYGPDLDKITLAEVRQTGARGVVTALHEVPYGEVWDRDLIARRRADVQAAGLDWTVCESLPLHEDIKRGDGDLAPLFAAYRQSLVNLAAEGVTTICYNFMPLLDWTRTDLAHPTEEGGTCLRFDAVKMAAYELCVLGRAAAEADYTDNVVSAARAWFQQADQAARDALQAAVMAGMPGAFDRYSPPALVQQLERYEGMTSNDLRSNFARFLAEVIPTAEEQGISLCVHPDDPPRDILGLPRIVSDHDDIAWIMRAADSPANGLTFCSGSLGAHPGNDVTAIAKAFADRIRFAHLRNVRKFPDGSFEEAPHLEGDTDMVALVRTLLREEVQRGEQFPFRPDHGQDILSDLGRGYIPGYPLIGRLKGLAELRGVIAAVAQFDDMGVRAVSV